MRSRLFVLICLLVLTTTSAIAQQTKPANFETKPKLVVGKINPDQPSEYVVKGKATFTLLHVHDTPGENSLEGKITYTIPDDARQKISQLTGKPLNQVPTSYSVDKVLASFQKATACPQLHINIKALEIDAVGAKIIFPSRVTLDIDGIEPGTLNDPTPEQEVAMNLCAWTRQINNGGIFRGVTRRIRELLYGQTQ